MEASAFDEVAMFRAIANSGVRALLIGRRALVACGLPVMTSDYDLWMPIEDATKLNEALRPFELYPTRAPDEARTHGRYVLEGDEHVDVLVAKGVSAGEGYGMVLFEDVWARRVYKLVADDVRVALPCLDDLILTKRFGTRPRDADDIRLLQQLRDNTR